MNSEQKSLYLTSYFTDTTLKQTAITTDIECKPEVYKIFKNLEATSKV
jgi:hypothetical protein